MGNEFGHPEWVDFPRPGNNFSHHYCLRRWDLCDNPKLRYKLLHNFDKSMHKLENAIGFLNAKHQYISLLHEKDKVIVFEKGDLLFIFNFHPTNSFEHYRIGSKWASEHLMIFDTDDFIFGGKDRLKPGRSKMFPIIKEKWNNRPNHLHLYIPSRTAIVLIAEENINKYNLDKLKD